MKTEQVFTRLRPLPPMLSPTRLSSASTTSKASKDGSSLLKPTLEMDTEADPKLQKQVNELNPGKAELSALP